MRGWHESYTYKFEETELSGGNGIGLYTLLSSSLIHWLLALIAGAYGVNAVSLGMLTGDGKACE